MSIIRKSELIAFANQLNKLNGKHFAGAEYISGSWRNIFQSNTYPTNYFVRTNGNNSGRLDSNFLNIPTGLHPNFIISKISGQTFISSEIISLFDNFIKKALSLNFSVATEDSRFNSLSGKVFQGNTFTFVNKQNPSLNDFNNLRASVNSMYVKNYGCYINCHSNCKSSSGSGD